MKANRGTRRFFSCAVVGMALAGGGCSTWSSRVEEPQPFRMVARRASSPIRVDGLLDEAVWAEAIVYPLMLSKADEEAGKTLTEAGLVRLSWDNDYLYIAIDYLDSDLVAEGEEDHLHHYRLGDLAEVFLKPEGARYYWELYVTPGGNRSTFFFPSRGRQTPSVFDYRFDLPVAAQIRGTLNDWRDTDTGWTAEMAVPVRELTARGASFEAGALWRILVARYNYGEPLTAQELSSTPKLSRTNFHLHEDYAILELAE
ncbi:MAG: carbohydrate-binding family 9-like protein [Kiritimatiellia bacterium]|nr:carbohydrate-binding family 9-like protein [Kiritimatiellia bacterium]